MRRQPIHPDEMPQLSMEAMIEAQQENEEEEVSALTGKELIKILEERVKDKRFKRLSVAEAERIEKLIDRLSRGGLQVTWTGQQRKGRQ